MERLTGPLIFTPPLFLARICVHGRADRPFECSSPSQGLSRLGDSAAAAIGCAYSGQNNRDRVAVANPVPDGRPFDQLHMNVMPGIMFIYPPDAATDDAKFTAQDLINLVAAGDIR